MTIEQTDTIDFLTLENETGDVLLTVSDHLDWSENENRHLVLLQDKLNAYLRFIDGGEITRKFPLAIGGDIVINVIGKFPCGEKATAFFAQARAAMLARDLRCFPTSNLSRINKETLRGS
jgi:amino acid transporter